MTQLDLNLSQSETRKANAPKLARMMMAILAAKGGWVKRQEIMNTYDWKDSRPVRLGRKASHHRILYGNRGFTLKRTATEEEKKEYLAILNKKRKDAEQEYLAGCKAIYGMTK